MTCTWASTLHTNSRCAVGAGMMIFSKILLSSLSIYSNYNLKYSLYCTHLNIGFKEHIILPFTLFINKVYEYLRCKMFVFYSSQQKQTKQIRF